ncbi:SDR family oxidoreductase [Agrobacterium vitis]|uniref:SDR family oxidoreductase n=1 Tax=Agrobacterium vitis TaxID=373 RepID=A0A7K1RXD8_AGRVI|nr:SDR family oxidoreductase [Agrobacterium vitis]MUO94798.1 SDR family oxidoreductase [Agrobacterium vitis]MUP05440.1 SDR family oxidoreductase [Agrobacterium vitis]MUZ81566.1 SDR family oxidoreductase [Agrobacterium vitis]MVA56686.1 SDR family oxidoreductase [Agrobacterium vitis]
MNNHPAITIFTVDVIRYGVPLEPIPGLATSNALRSALAGWAKTLATEVAEDGVTVNVVMPGRFATPRTTTGRLGCCWSCGGRKRHHRPKPERNPDKTIWEPQEFGEVVTFLASDEASMLQAPPCLSMVGSAMRCCAPLVLIRPVVTVNV